MTPAATASRRLWFGSTPSPGGSFSMVTTPGVVGPPSPGPYNAASADRRVPGRALLERTTPRGEEHQHGRAVRQVGRSFRRGLIAVTAVAVATAGIVGIVSAPAGADTAVGYTIEVSIPQGLQQTLP